MRLLATTAVCCALGSVPAALRKKLRAALLRVLTLLESLRCQGEWYSAVEVLG